MYREKVIWTKHESTNQWLILPSGVRGLEGSTRYNTRSTVVPTHPFIHGVSDLLVLRYLHCVLVREIPVFSLYGRKIKDPTPVGL